MVRQIAESEGNSSTGGCSAIGGRFFRRRAVLRGRAQHSDGLSANYNYRKPATGSFSAY